MKRKIITAAAASLAAAAASIGSAWACGSIEYADLEAGKTYDFLESSVKRHDPRGEDPTVLRLAKEGATYSTKEPEGGSPALRASAGGVFSGGKRIARWDARWGDDHRLEFLGPEGGTYRIQAWAVVSDFSYAAAFEVSREGRVIAEGMGQMGCAAGLDPESTAADVRARVAVFLAWKTREEISEALSSKQGSVRRH